MPTDTQRAPTGEEIEAVGQDVRAAMSRLAVAQIRAARLNASIGTMENVADAESALIIAIAKRVREADERGMLGTDFPATPEAPHA